MTRKTEALIVANKKKHTIYADLFHSKFWYGDIFDYERLKLTCTNDDQRAWSSAILERHEKHLIQFNVINFETELDDLK